MLKSFFCPPRVEVRQSMPFNSARLVMALSCHCLTHREGWAVQQLLLSSSWIPFGLCAVRTGPGLHSRYPEVLSGVQRPSPAPSPSAQGSLYVCLSHWLRTMVHSFPFSLLTSCMTHNLGGTTVDLKLAGSVLSELHISISCRHPGHVFSQNYPPHCPFDNACIFFINRIMLCFYLWSICSGCHLTYRNWPVHKLCCD